MSIDQIKILELDIIKHKDLYYQGRAEISDVEYDLLEEKLRGLDPENRVLQVVGSSIISNEKIRHDKKMLSLAKTYSVDDLFKWMEGHNVVSTFKIDGSSCSIIYKDGRISLAKTRGDGRFGENITSKILCLNSVPKAVKNKINFEVRGEVFCTEENFFKLTTEMERRNLDRPTSMRNIVAGILGRKENIDLASYLSFQAFELISEEKLFKSEKEKFEKLNDLSFKTPDFEIVKNKDDLKRSIDAAKEFIINGNYLIDGIVYTVDASSKHEEMGETAHHPRYKMAFKFQGDTKITKINTISWQVSRNRILTPVANIEPVELSGAMVSRVTLHNFGLVKVHELKAGDEIEVVRSGEVIPKFLRVINSSTEKFSYPLVCPSCHSETRTEDIRLLCTNINCSGKILDEILNFIQKIGIDDLSSKRLEDLMKAGLIKDISSLYALTKEDLLGVDKIKEKLASKILGSIEKSKDVNLIDFMASIGLRGGAYNKCEKVVNAGVDTIEKFMNLTRPQLENIESFAEKSAADFVISLASKKELIEKLVSYGFVFKTKVAPLIESEITGKMFCITGTLSMKRSDLQKLVKSNGGIVQGSVSTKTDYLLTNDTESSSSKFKKAKELEIRIINEGEFLNLIGE